MAWRAPWARVDPVEKRRRELARQQALLEAQAQALQDQIAEVSAPRQPEPIAERQPAVWRNDPDESDARRSTHPEPPTRVLSAKRRRDRNLFILYAVPLVVLVGWIIHAWLQAK